MNNSNFWLKYEPEGKFNLLELLENNAEEKKIFLEDLINKIYYDQF